ncbi:MAG: GHKL domain-containing protein [Ferruginibacter sp.]|nr:GHKL domain-containing protein [Cytophagales bacterium]
MKNSVCFWLRGLVSCLLGIGFALSGWAAPSGDPVVVAANRLEYDLTPHLEILRGEDAAAVGVLTIEDILAGHFTGKFGAFSPESADAETAVHWLRFTVRNLNATGEFKLSLTFTDHLRFYFPDSTGQYRLQETGDLKPFGKRAVPVGRLNLVRFSLPYGVTRTYYLRLESQSGLSQQFRKSALRSVRLYTGSGFADRFESTRIHQALFFGAMLMMLLYNLFVYATLRQPSYLHFSFFIFCLVIFFAADRGYLFEIFLPDHPRLDLYVRFLSTPLLSVAYVVFSRSYLQSSRYFPGLDRTIRGLPWLFGGIAALMGMGYWGLGRTLAIAFAIVSLFLVLYLAIRSLLKDYTPARYFVVANLLFLVGAIVFSSQRFFFTESRLVQYSLQLAASLQVALFSMGLTDRIQLMQRELATQTAQAQRLEKEAALERERIIEEKNRELETKVRERTTEMMVQKEEIETQNEHLATVNEELSTTQETIELQNQVLENANLHLEFTVQARTLELNVSNEKLRQAIYELDSFIYRTAHDIRGPLARLLGLCGVASLDVEDPSALVYLEKLHFEARNLDYILGRLSAVYEISDADVRREAIDFGKLKADLRASIGFVENLGNVRLRIDLAENIACQSDYALLLFIVRNLLENAVKFRKETAEGSYVYLQIGTQGEALVIRVVDNGIGIDPDDAPLIFNLFSRAAVKHKTAGMGLYMVKRGVEKLDGTIALADTTAGLTEFRVSIPLGPHPVSALVQPLPLGV